MANKRFWERYREEQKAKAAEEGNAVTAPVPEEVKDDPYRASDEEIRGWIEDYGFRLPDEDPTDGGFVCDYFPDLEEDVDLQKRILYNHYRIYEFLMAEYMEEQKKKDAVLRVIK